MAANDNVTVRIVGDASGVQPAVDVAASSIESLQPILAQISTQMAALNKTMTEAFVSGAAGSKQLAAGMAEARVATEAEGNALVGMVMKIHEGAEAVRTFQMRAKEFAELYVAMFGAEIIAHWAESLGEAAEKIEKLSAKTGMTVPQVQALSGAATMSGTNIDALAKGLQMMANRSVTVTSATSSSAKALHAMGISANDGTTNMQRLLMIADKFHAMADGPQKAALAMQLFGRSGAEMIPFLNQGGAAIQQLMEKSKELGLVNEKAVEQGARLAESVNESKVAWEGLKETLTQAFAPLLTEIVDGFIQLVEEMKQSYDTGGLVKVIFDTISETIQALGQMIGAVALAFDSLFATTKGQGLDWGAIIRTVIEGVVVAFKTLVAMVVFVADAWVAGFHLMKAGAESFLEGFTESTGQIRVLGTGLGEFMQVVGKVCYDALHLDWGDIKADWSNGMEQVRQAVAAKAQEIVGEVNKMKDAVKADFNDMLSTGKNFQDFYNQLMAPGQAPKHDAFKLNFGGGSDEVPDIAGGHGKKRKKPKSPKDDIVQQLEQELEAKKELWDEEQIAQDTAQQYSLESEAAFWKEALSRTDLSAKDRLEITKKYQTAEMAAQKEAEDEKLAQMKREVTEDGNNYAKKVADLKRWAAEMHRFYGDRSKEVQAADQEVANLEKQAAEASRKAWDEYYKAVEQMALERVSDEQAQAQFEVDMGEKTKGQLIAQEKAFENQRYAIHLQELNRERALIDPNRDPAAYQKICLQIEQLEQQHQNKLNEIDRKAVLERTAIERTAINSISQGWADAIGKMVTLQQGFAATIKSLWQTVQQAIGSAIASILQQWLEQQLSALLLGKAQKAAEATGEVGANAAVAASGAYAATAAIPIIGPELAPAAAATAYAGALSWLGSISMAGFDVGAWNLSRDQVAMVHAGEMIIPPELAGGMRSLFQSVNDNGRLPANDGGGGDTHLHFHGPVIGSRSAMEQWARENRHMFGAGMRAFVRGGGSADPYRVR